MVKVSNLNSLPKLSAPKTVAKTNSCKGYCCAAFSLTTLKKMAREEVEPTWNDYPCDGTWERAHERWRDVQKAADMLIPLGKHKRNPIHPQRQDDRDDIRVNFFTCKYFDGETRNCLDYEDRPRMCSSFPNSQSTCPYEGCKHFNAKERIVRRPFGAETKKAKKEKV